MTEPKAQYPTKEQVDPAIKKAEQNLRELVADFEHVLLPVIEVMAEQAKSLVTLSSSALVLSFSVLHLAQPAKYAYAWMLGTAWVLFAATVAIGAFWHYFYRDFHRFRLGLSLAMENLRQAMLTTPFGPNWLADREAITGKDLQSVAKDNLSAILWLDRCNAAMSVCFTLGLVALVGFAIANLP